jgi:hypothetical protein
MLHISHAAVFQWINGTTKPSAELTLRVQEWVTASEAKQENKNRGSVKAPPRRKAQSTRSKYETKKRIKTGPRKR